MSFDTFQACLATVPVSVAIHFLGMAEPWLNPDCTRMVLYAHEKGHAISVSTTLAGMRPQDIASIRHIPFEAFILHLPGKDDRMTIDVDADYIDLLNGICRNRIQNLKFKRFGAIHPQVAPILGHVEEAVWPMMNRANNLTSGGIRPTTKVRGTISCHRKRNNVLLPNGDVVLCCNDYGLRHILGNLLEINYEELFRGDEFRRVRDGMTHDDAEILCRYCSEPCMKVRYHFRNSP